MATALKDTPNPRKVSDGRTTYKANCHCGAVRFTVTLPTPFPEYKINKCNCSICTKNGYLLVYPTRKDVVFSQGYDNLGDYFFGQKKKPHKFCKTCGTSILIDFKLMEYGETNPEKDELAVNVRTFEDFDPDDPKLQWTYFDGRTELKPPYCID